MQSSNENNARPKVAIVTGGTRGIGKGIAKALAETGNYHGFILSYNSNQDAAEAYRTVLEQQLRQSLDGTPREEAKVCIVGGDLSVPENRDKIFHCFDHEFPHGDLCTLVHNAGQYVGVTSANEHGIDVSDQPRKFGDGSLLNDESKVDFESMRFYQKLYGEAFVDLCERSLKRMKDAHARCVVDNCKYRGSIVGISSPGCNAAFKMTAGYDMPGSGKCVMEFAIRHYAHSAAEYGINCNVIIPGVTSSDAWGFVAGQRGMAQDQLMGIMENVIPMKEVANGKDIGDVVAFLSGSGGGRFMTGLSLRVDGGLHLGK